MTARVSADTAVLATAGDTLWVLEHDGTLLAVSGATRHVVARLARLAPVADNSPENLLVADADGAWIADPAANTVLHVAGGRVVRRVGVRSTPGALTLAAGAVWVTTGDVISRRYRLLRLSPATGRITGTVDLGHHEPQAVVPTADGVGSSPATGRRCASGPPNRDLATVDIPHWRASRASNTISAGTRPRVRRPVQDGDRTPSLWQSRG